MASVVREKTTGRYRVEFTPVCDKLKRGRIRLGEVSERFANDVAEHVENLLTAARYGSTLERKTVRWLTEITDTLHRKLVRAGLAEPRTRQETPADTLLGPFLDALLARRTDIKETTRTNYLAAITSLKAFFGESKPLADVTPGDAEDFRRWLLTAKKYSEAIRKVVLS